jgi:hypothetical protein
MNRNSGMRSIWFLVGSIMSVIGFIVLVAGIYNLFHPADQNIRLSNLHANIWWGLLIMATGLVYLLKNKNKYNSP